VLDGFANILITIGADHRLARHAQMLAPSLCTSGGRAGEDHRRLDGVLPIASIRSRCS
jgi:hypothetical protein